MNSNGELRKYMQAIGETVEGLRGDHLDEEKLVAYYENQLPPAERESAKLHFRSCELCANKLEDLRDFFDPLRKDEEEMGEFEQVKLWRGLREKAEFQSILNDQIPSTDRKKFFLNSRTIYALAAGLLITTSLTGFIAFRLWQETRRLEAFINQNHNSALAKLGQGDREGLEQALSANKALQEKLSETENKLLELQKPQINPPVAEITVNDPVRSSTPPTGQSNLITNLQPKANFILITLNIVSDSFPSYKIEFTDADGNPVFNQANLKPNERADEKSSAPRPNQHATLSVSLPSQSFNKGKYMFRVYGQNASRSVLLETLNWSFN